MKRLVRQAILWHRYLGVCFCLFFAVWFASGVVMMYASMPQLTEADRLAHLPPLDLSAARLGPAEAFERSGVNDGPQRITIGMAGQRPVYRFLSELGTWVTVFADDGQVLRQLEPAAAIRIASQYNQSSPNRMHIIGEVSEADQWTIYPGSGPYFPFRKIATDDGRGTEYYVSEASGSVYLQTTRRSRLLAWCGAIPHWWYIRALRSRASLWRDVLIGASGWGVLLCVAGIVAGLLRFSPSRRYRFPEWRYSSIPYAGWKRWHYLLAAVFGLATFTWILSGLFTMDPGDWSPGPDPSEDEIQAFAGGDLNPGLFRVAPSQAADSFRECLRPVELEMMLFHGRPYYLARDQNSQERLLSAQDGAEGCISELPAQELLEAGKAVVGDAPVAELTRLSAYDSYYYDRDRQKPLPILRVRFADARGTWLYLNPRTGLIEARYTNRSRLERWLYSGLHDLDFPFLYWHRPAWDLTVIGLSAGGLALSITSMVLALKYLRRQFKRRVLMRWAREGPERH